VTPRLCYGSWPELDRVELGARAAYAYDEDFAIAYRFATAEGLERGSVAASTFVIDLQRRWSVARRASDDA